MTIVKLQPVAVVVAAESRRDLEGILAADRAFELLDLTTVAESTAAGWVVMVLDEAATRRQLALMARVGDRVRVVALLRFPSPMVGGLLFDTGVSSLPLTAPVEDLLTSIRLAASGGCFLLDGDGHRVERSAPDRLLTPK
jgi:hypothetical protein